MDRRLRPSSVALAVALAAGGLVLPTSTSAAQAEAPPVVQWHEEQVDTIGPRVEVISPEVWNDWDHALIDVGVRITDVDDAASTVQVAARLDDLEPVAIPFDAETGTHRGDVDLSEAEEGGHTLVVTATDPDGHQTILSGSLSAVIKPTVALLGAWSGLPEVTGEVEVQASASDPQSPPSKLEVRVGAAKPDVYPYELGDESDPLTYDPLSQTFTGTWDSSTVPNAATWTQDGVTHDAWPMVVQATDPDGLTATDGRLVRPHNDESREPSFRPAGPVRLLDTRPGSAVGATGGAPQAGKVLTVAIPGHAALGLPAGTDEAVALSVTATEATATGWVTAWPCGTDRPTASSVNVTEVGQTVANLVLAKPGSSGEVCLFTSSPMHLVVDLTGVVPAGTGFTALSRPTRVVDTRTINPATPPKDAVVVAQVVGPSEVPFQAEQVAVNVTVTGARGPGWVSVTSCNDPNPAVRYLGTSTLNVDRAGQTVANFTVSEIGSHGSVCVYTSAGAHVVVDVLGYWRDGVDTGGGPVRIADTRTGSKPGAGSVTRVSADGAVGLPAGQVGGVLVNVTVAEARGAGFSTVYPCGQTRPWTSNLNVVRSGQTVAVGAATGLDPNGDLCVFQSAGGHVVVDLVGWFPGVVGAAPAAARPTTSTVTTTTAEVTAMASAPGWGLGKVHVAPNDPSDDLVWYRPARYESTLVGYRWDGSYDRTLVLEDHWASSGDASPDGRLFEFGYRLVDADGRATDVISYGGFADDNRHGCYLSYQRQGQDWDDPYRLDVRRIDGEVVKIADLPQQDPNSSVQLISCSVQHDRAVMFMNHDPRREAVIVRLSDGARLPTPLPCRNPLQVSADGRFLVGKDAVGTTNLCDLDTGLVVDTFPEEWKHGISVNSDASQVWVGGAESHSCNHNVKVLDRLTRQELWWSCEPGWELPWDQGYSVASRHYDGPESLLAIYTVNDGAATEKVFIVGADGRPWQIADGAHYGGYFPNVYPW